MERKEVLEQLKQIAKKCGFDTTHVSEKSSLQHDLKMDSLDSVDFLMECEQHFQISLPLSVVAHISTVGDLIEAVHHEVMKRN